MSYNQSKPYDNSKNNNDNVNDSYNDNDNNNDKDNDNVNFWSSCLIFCKKIFRKSHITDTIFQDVETSVTTNIICSFLE